MILFIAMGPLSVSVLMVFVALLEKVPPVWSHGRLMSPPSRSSMWRFGFDTPTNWNDNELFCGGLSVSLVLNIFLLTENYVM